MEIIDWILKSPVFIDDHLFGCTLKFNFKKINVWSYLCLPIWWDNVCFKFSTLYWDVYLKILSRSKVTRIFITLILLTIFIKQMAGWEHFSHHKTFCWSCGRNLKQKGMNSFEFKAFNCQALLKNIFLYATLLRNFTSYWQLIEY